jgi:hypothetical protein
MLLPIFPRAKRDLDIIPSRTMIFSAKRVIPMSGFEPDSPHPWQPTHPPHLTGIRRHRLMRPVTYASCTEILPAYLIDSVFRGEDCLSYTPEGCIAA